MLLFCFSFAFAKWYVNSFPGASLDKMNVLREPHFIGADPGIFGGGADTF